MEKPIRTCAVLIVGLACAGPVTGMAETGGIMRISSAQPSYILNITGSDAGVDFSGECWVRQADGSERRVALDGALPQRRELQGEGLRCDIVQESAAGSLTVEIMATEGGNRSRSRTQGAGSRVRVQMR
jgi:hypothetical protein